MQNFKLFDRGSFEFHALRNPIAAIDGSGNTLLFRTIVKSVFSSARVSGFCQYFC
ncbi:protein of unknown function [Methylocaldum szegediense]|uniref:Uncharacterized protein n=1 Tax=Methylocaldum szegediense TaxID=73780 RepID=A0ABM9I0N0_9GAMM|nr:protein of unknown function [Methylocaldum szegediense]